MIKKINKEKELIISLKAYVFSLKDSDEPSAILIIAESFKEAKKIAWKELWHEGRKYTDLRGSKIKEQVDISGIPKGLVSLSYKEMFQRNLDILKI